MLFGRRGVYLLVRTHTRNVGCLLVAVMTVSWKIDSTSAAPEDLRTTTRVTLTGLATKPELNGLHGNIVRRLESSTSRYGVLVDGHEQPLALRPANLTVRRVTKVQVLMASHIDTPARMKRLRHCLRSILRQTTYAHLMLSWSAATPELALSVFKLLEELFPKKEERVRLRWGSNLHVIAAHQPPDAPTPSQAFFEFQQQELSRFEHYKLLAEKISTLSEGVLQYLGIPEPWVLFSEDDAIWHPRRLITYCKLLEHLHDQHVAVHAVTCAWHVMRIRLDDESEAIPATAPATPATVPATAPASAPAIAPAIAPPDVTPDATPIILPGTISAAPLVAPPTPPPAAPPAPPIVPSTAPLIAPSAAPIASPLVSSIHPSMAPSAPCIAPPGFASVKEVNSLLESDRAEVKHMDLPPGEPSAFWASLVRHGRLLDFFRSADPALVASSACELAFAEFVCKGFHPSAQVLAREHSAHGCVACEHRVAYDAHFPWLYATPGTLPHIGYRKGGPRRDASLHSNTHDTT